MTTKDFWCLGFAFLLSFVLSLATTPLAKRVAYIIGAVDIPRDSRRMHKRPIPRCGGLAIIFGFMASVLCFGPPTRGLAATMIGAGIIAIMGVVDDCKNLDAKLKFVIQIIAALIVVYGGDFKIEVMTNPNIFSDSPYIVFPWWLSGIVTVLWVVFITNAVNFIDGLDGLAAGVSAIMSVSLVFIAMRSGEYSVAVMGTALMGACFGFLPFNFNPARIFMGDTGSTFLGFMLASLSIQGVFKSYAIISFAVPLLILGLPLFDAMFAMFRRILKGQNPMTADRGHLHHRLIDMGFSTKQSVFILYAISGVLGITAVLLAEKGTLMALGTLCAVLIFIVLETTMGKTSNKNTKVEEENEED
ncbi:MAG: undecaprenyl/decaprenyl-phosphate alpha-N-acetylglucosaminyl 1-phosphate transferase [Clostridia bacterium]|nr:undecaprenyl/decaprenyl-phosphate alpha-N-acetylglucosaminyl 1-phosphate transferase [Clostridia bacterium]